MRLLTIAIKSARNRKASIILALLSIAISIGLILGIDTVRKNLKAGFLNTISGTDLIVGARGGDINLLLYSVFRIGDATKNVSYENYQKISQWKNVSWTVPISLGDSHRGYRVMGTTLDFFTHYQYGVSTLGGSEEQSQTLQFHQGGRFQDLYDVVLGYEVAQKLNYRLGDSIIVAHGLASLNQNDHDDKPFKVVGILSPTATPVDRAVYVSLEAIEAIHVDWQSGAPSPIKIGADLARKFDLTPKTITAFLVGLNRKIDTFRVQRGINGFADEPLMAIIPGVTLAQLWKTIGFFENTLLAIAMMVLVAGLIGLLITLLSTVHLRRQEMAILRAIGAHPYQILFLYILEAFLVVACGSLLGVGLLGLVHQILQPVLIDWLGLRISWMIFDGEQLTFLGVTIILGMLFSIIPGIYSYRQSLQDGLTVKV